MALSDEKIRSYVKRLLLSRMRILCDHGFYGLLLMHMNFAIDENCDTAATDGVKIYFGPEFLDDLSDGELDFVMMHEIMHVVLQHCLRGGERDREQFNIACDIVVNSNILLSNNNDISSIELKKYGVAMHVAPNGKEGHNYTAEEVYAMLPQDSAAQAGGNSGSRGKTGGDGGKGKDRSGNGGKGNGKKSDGGTGSNGGGKVNGGGGEIDGAQWDDHSRWGSVDDDGLLKDLWIKRFSDALESMRVRDPSNERGTIPAFAKRLLEELVKPQTDWRTILNEFVQEEITDYSFSPPDRRYDGPFMLPDFNEKEDTVEDILFMIDTSGSMSDGMITAAFSEVKGAIEQFNGRLKGWLGFFDAAIIEPTPFENVEEFEVIKPAGGGGTDFGIIFKYVEKFMEDSLPASIIILTDGYAPFPPEVSAHGIPVLWLLNNTDVTPPWGKTAMITV
ncbi:MAG: hypothetical protein J1F39_02890 [Clostridiales bacterium]|nr:hypothetical protein [Clostridiales bacterium]